MAAAIGAVITDATVDGTMAVIGAVITAVIGAAATDATGATDAAATGAGTIAVIKWKRNALFSIFI